MSLSGEPCFFLTPAHLRVGEYYELSVKAAPVFAEAPARVAASVVLVAAGNVRSPGRSAIFRPWEQQREAGQEVVQLTAQAPAPADLPFFLFPLLFALPAAVGVCSDRIGWSLDRRRWLTAGLRVGGELTEHRVETADVRQHLV